MLTSLCSTSIRPRPASKRASASFRFLLSLRSVPGASGGGGGGGSGLR